MNLYNRFLMRTSWEKQFQPQGNSETVTYTVAELLLSKKRPWAGLPPEQMNEEDMAELMKTLDERISYALRKIEHENRPIYKPSVFESIADHFRALAHSISRIA